MDNLKLDAYRCPVCDQRFASEKAVTEHATETKRHDNILQYAWKMRFLLAEAERAADIFKLQRDEWREHAHALRRRTLTEQRLRGERTMTATNKTLS